MRDPMSAVAAAIPTGAIYDRARLSDDESAFRSRELWQDWYKPRDMYQGLTSNLLNSGGTYWFFDIHRGSKQEAFGADEIELLQKIVPHVLRAGEIGRKLEQTSALASAFSHLPFGVLLVNGRQGLVQMNEAAEAMLARRDSPLVLSDGEIAASNPRDTETLRRLVASACLLSDDALPGTGGTLLVPSDRERHDLTRLVLSVAPFFDARAYGITAESCAVIMITEVARRIPDGFEAHVRGLFDLTPAEARLSAALAAGQSLKESAIAANVTVKTCRTYLDRIFAKTRTHQQSELVALLKSTEPLNRRGP
jgi:DNA-binding CsgD family transcriptional regulator